MTERFKGWLVVAAAYIVAFVAAMFAVRSIESHPLIEIGVAQLVATAVFFMFSFASNNSSINDTYWSSSPIAFVIYYLSISGFDENTLRKVLLLCVVCFWGLRLTAYVLYYWRGINHEDWRFAELRQKTGRAYWAVSLFGLHLLPAALTFLASMSFYPIIFSNKDIDGLDLIPVIIVIAALIIGAVADELLRKFRISTPRVSQVLCSGIWSVSRHPNYVGETLFWWGIWLMGVSVDMEWWWTVIGPVGITCLFHFASIDLMEDHLMEKKGYAEYRSRVARYFPLAGK